MMQSIRILVADDFSPWRAQVRKILQERPDWQIVCEACDGQKAVQHAAELRPDIVILDIEMPVLNGIKAAKQIRNTSADAKIVFLTQEADADIIDEALSTGTARYVVKARAARELLLAIEAALSDGHRRAA